MIPVFLNVTGLAKAQGEAGKPLLQLPLTHADDEGRREAGGGFHDVFKDIAMPEADVSLEDVEMADEKGPSSKVLTGEKDLDVAVDETATLGVEFEVQLEEQGSKPLFDDVDGGMVEVEFVFDYAVAQQRSSEVEVIAPDSATRSESRLNAEPNVFATPHASVKPEVFVAVPGGDAGPTDARHVDNDPHAPELPAVHRSLSVHGALAERPLLENRAPVSLRQALFADAAVPEPAPDGPQGAATKGPGTAADPAIVTPVEPKSASGAAASVKDALNVQPYDQRGLPAARDDRASVRPDLSGSAGKPEFNPRLPRFRPEGSEPQAEILERQIVSAKPEPGRAAIAEVSAQVPITEGRGQGRSAKIDHPVVFKSFNGPYRKESVDGVSRPDLADVHSGGRSEPGLSPPDPTEEHALQRPGLPLGRTEFGADPGLHPTPAKVPLISPALFELERGDEPVRIAERAGESLGSLAPTTAEVRGLTGSAVVNTTSSSLPRYVSQQITLGIRSAGGNAVEIMLNPAELGAVRIGLSQGDGGWLVSVHADRQDTLDLLRRHIEILGQDLHDIGYGGAEFLFGEGAGQPMARFSEGLADAEEGAVSEAAVLIEDGGTRQPQVTQSGRVDVRV